MTSTGDRWYDVDRFHDGPVAGSLFENDRLYYYVLAGDDVVTDDERVYYVLDVDHPPTLAELISLYNHKETDPLVLRTITETQLKEYPLRQETEPRSLGG